MPVSGLACSYGTFFYPAYLWSRLLVCRHENFYNKITRRGDDSRRDVSLRHVNRSTVIRVFCSYVHFSVKCYLFPFVRVFGIRIPTCLSARRKVLFMQEANKKFIENFSVARFHYSSCPLPFFLHPWQFFPLIISHCETFY